MGLQQQSLRNGQGYHQVIFLIVLETRTNVYLVSAENLQRDSVAWQSFFFYLVQNSPIQFRQHSIFTYQI